MALGVERAEKDNDIDTSPPGGPSRLLTENTESFHRLSTWQEWAG